MTYRNEFYFDVEDEAFLLSYKIKGQEAFKTLTAGITEPWNSSRVITPTQRSKIMIHWEK